MYNSKVNSILLSLIFWSTWAHGAVFNEVGDAGNLPVTAQTTTVTNQVFDEITGTLSPSTGDGEDLYKIFVTGGGDFSATTKRGATFDSELFLLDSSGRGVYSNDDTAGFFDQSILPAHNPLTPLAAGYYYLGITQCCDEPVSAGGAIFTGLNGGSNHLILSGPTGVGGSLPITGYSTHFDQSPGGGAYTIFLTGAQIAPAVPEPASWILIFAGLGVVCAVSLRRTRSLPVRSNSEFFRRTGALCESSR